MRSGKLSSGNQLGKGGQWGVQRLHPSLGDREIMMTTTATVVRSLEQVECLRHIHPIIPFDGYGRPTPIPSVSSATCIRAALPCRWVVGARDGEISIHTTLLSRKRRRTEGSKTASPARFRVRFNSLPLFGAMASISSLDTGHEVSFSSSRCRHGPVSPLPDFTRRRHRLRCRRCFVLALTLSVDGPACAVCLRVSEIVHKACAGQVG